MYLSLFLTMRIKSAGSLSVYCLQRHAIRCARLGDLARGCSVSTVDRRMRSDSDLNTSMSYLWFFIGSGFLLYGHTTLYICIYITMYLVYVTINIVYQYISSMVDSWTTVGKFVLRHACDSYFLISFDFVIWDSLFHNSNALYDAYKIYAIHSGFVLGK